MSLAIVCVILDRRMVVSKGIHIFSTLPFFPLSFFSCSAQAVQGAVEGAVAGTLWGSFSVLNDFMLRKKALAEFAPKPDIPTPIQFARQVSYVLSSLPALFLSIFQRL